MLRFTQQDKDGLDIAVALIRAASCAVGEAAPEHCASRARGGWDSLVYRLRWAPLMRMHTQDGVMALPANETGFRPFEGSQMLVVLHAWREIDGFADGRVGREPLLASRCDQRLMAGCSTSEAITKAETTASSPLSPIARQPGTGSQVPQRTTRRSECTLTSRLSG